MGKSVIITGATSGIGRALSLELAGRGWHVGLCGRREATLDEVAAEIRSAGGRCAARMLDVQKPETVGDALDALTGDLGGMDVVVANAGIAGAKRVGTGNFERDRAIIETNVIGAMATVDAAAVRMRAAGGGHIVGISSVAGFRGIPGEAAYCASKAALSTYLEAARADLRASSIRVSDLAPGYIDTPLNAHIKSRPFVISVAEGARIAADMIERGTLSATVPRMPWAPVGAVLKHLPGPLWNLLTNNR